MNLQNMAMAPAPSDQPAPASKAKPATPEQQAQFDTLLGSCRQVIGGTAEEWMSALKVNPVAAAVKMGTQTVRYFARQYEKAGQPFAPEVIIHVGITLVKDIAGVVNDAGLVPDDKLEGYLKDVTQQSIAEYMRMDAEDGKMPEGGEQEKSLPGDPTTPDDTAEHEGTETPSFEKKEIAAEPAETGEDGMSEEDEMALQLKNIRAKRGAQ